MEPTSLVSNRRAKTACSTISAAVRCLLRPILHNNWTYNKLAAKIEQETKNLNVIELDQRMSEGRQEQCKNTGK